MSLKERLISAKESGIIAEFKRKSPSRGIINNKADLIKTTTGYVKAGASALSVLTDNKYFAGSNIDLIEARKYNKCPILRKDFIIDEYQVIEAKSIGADVILLIAAILTKEKADRLTKTAHLLGLEVLTEMHKQEEIKNVSENSDLIGVNNRNLDNFDVDIYKSIFLSEKISSNIVKISESGISDPDIIKKLKTYGFRGFLIGENFMKTENPSKSCEKFIKKLL